MDYFLFDFSGVQFHYTMNHFFFACLTVIFFYAVNKCVIINDTCHFCEEVEIFMCR